MLPRKSLIKLRTEFPRIRQQGKLFNSQSFSLSISYSTNSQPLCAFIVSKKTSPKSVIRHDVKRKLSDAITPFFPHLPKNIELTFIAKSQAISSTREELSTEISQILKRAKIIN